MSFTEDFIVNGRFKVVKKLGTGAQGKVYNVQDLNDSYKNKALKEIKVISSEDLETVKRELKILQKLECPYIVKYLDYNHDVKNGYYYILTELYEDGTLEEIISKNKLSKTVLEYENILIWLLQLLRGIDYLHSNSIIHRDIKPQNIFLHRYNLVLGDLGLAKDAAIISAKSITKGIGTMSYMAPEIFQEKPYDYKIDIWAFGCVLYEMIKLEKFFNGTFYQITSAINNFEQENIKLDDLPKVFETVLLKTINKLPERRSSAKELITFITENIFEKSIKKEDLASNYKSREASEIQTPIIQSKLEAVAVESEFWNSCNAEREHYNNLFNQLSSNEIYLSGEKAREFFKKSELKEDVLTKFWNLIDFNKDGRLDKKEFGIACYLIKKVITEGQNSLPDSLPSYLFETPMDISESYILPKSTLIETIDSNKKKENLNKLKGVVLSNCFRKIKFYDIRSGKNLKEIEGHKKDICSLSIISDELLATGSLDKTIKIWDLNTDECLKTLEGHQWSITKIESIVNETKKLLISISLSEIKLWDIETGECISTLIEYAKGIQDIKVLNEDTIATSDVEGLIHIWNLNSKKCINTIEAHKGMLAPHSVKCLLYLSNDILISGSKDKKIKLWNYKSGKLIDTLEGVFSGHAAAIKCLAKITDDILVSGSSDNTIKLWNLKSGKCAKTLKGHSGKVTCLEVDTSNLYSASEDGTIKIWNIITGECISTINNNNCPVYSLKVIVD